MKYQQVIKANTQVIFIGEDSQTAAATCTIVLLPVAAEMDAEFLAKQVQMFLAQQIAIYFTQIGANQ